MMIFSLNVKLKEEIEKMSQQKNISQGAVCRIAVSEYMENKKNEYAKMEK